MKKRLTSVHCDITMKGQLSSISISEYNKRKSVNKDGHVGLYLAWRTRREGAPTPRHGIDGVMSPRRGLVLRNLRPQSLVVYNAQRRTRQASREGMWGTSCFAKVLRPSFIPEHTRIRTQLSIHIVSFSFPPKNSSRFCISYPAFFPFVLTRISFIDQLYIMLSKRR